MPLTWNLSVITMMLFGVREASAEVVSDSFIEEWDLDGPCQSHIKAFAVAGAKMVNCAATFSSPPKVCTNCIEEYIFMKQMEYDLHHLVVALVDDLQVCARAYSLYAFAQTYKSSSHTSGCSEQSIKRGRIILMCASLELRRSLVQKCANCILYNTVPPLQTNVTSLDGSPCSNVIYSNYLVSYNQELSSAITNKIWEASKCSACIKIDWGFEKNNTNYSFVQDTYIFQSKLFEWRHCLANYSIGEDFDWSKNYSAVCKNCLTVFDSLFDYYWDSYMKPELDFCLDVETTMNDSMNLWHNVWRCSEDKVKDREHDWTFVLFSFAMLTSVTFFFYVGSYVQSERSQRHLVQYSRLEAPHGTRSRLLSSSNFSDDTTNLSNSAAGSRTT